MDQLQAAIKQPLAVLPQPPVLLQPGKAALDDPALGDHCKLVQFAALGNLHCDLLAQRLAHTLSKRLTRIPAITQHALHSSQAWLAAPERLQCALAIGYLGRGDRHCMGKALRIDCNVALDARDLLACVIALERCCVRVLDALRVNDQERRAGVAPQFLSGRANLIFLKPAPER